MSRSAVVFLGALFLSGSMASCSNKRPEPLAVADTALPETRCATGENLQLCGKNLVIAHRGGAKVWPEETLVAFNEAVKLGVDVLELDVHATSDGKIVCNHDDLVDR